MLSWIRNSTIGIILAFIFMISLFFFKSSSRFSGVLGLGANNVAKVGEVQISNVEYLRTYDLTKKQFNQLIGSEITDKEAKGIGLDKNALGALINKAIFENEYINNELLIDDKVIASITQNYIPSIYDSNNNIISDNLKSFLIDQNLNLEEFIKIINYEAQNNFYENSLIQNIKYPLNINDKLNQYNNHTRDITYLILPTEKLNLEVVENEESITKFYNNNTNLFMKPEERTIEYIYLNPNDFIKDFIIYDDDIDQYYNNNKIMFTKNETRSFIQFNFNLESEAEDFFYEASNINKYNELKKLAKNKNIRFQELINAQKNEIIEVISNNVFSINKGELSTTINGPLGYHLVFVQDIKPAKLANLDTVKEIIVTNIKKERSSNYIQNLISEIDEEILNGLSLNEIKNKFSLKSELLNNVTADFKFSNENKYKKLIVEKAFKSNPNITSDIIEINNDSYFLFNVSNINIKSLEKYEDIKTKVAEKWKNKEYLILVEKYIEKLENDDKSKFIQSSFVEYISDKYNVDFKNTTIDKKSDVLPVNLINSIYANNVDKIVKLYDDKNVYLAKTNSINIQKESTSINSDIKVNVNDEIRAMILKGISKNIVIKTNDDLLNSLTSSM
ncbi:MAG: hypothetical protein CMI95_02355 [Pelagibacteraceae bacterium]|nr:hypothetical protein [Pelagibacteraceae bacterium]